MTHPIFGGEDARRQDVLSLIDGLQAAMGFADYCVWLAKETPVEWLTTTPAAEIADVMRAKLEQETTK